MKTLATYAILLTMTLATGAILGECARAQVSGYTMDMGDGWYRHSWTDGTTGYSMPMGQGWQRHSLSDGTTGYSMPMDEGPIAPYAGPQFILPQFAIPQFRLITPIQ